MSDIRLALLQTKKAVFDTASGCKTLASSKKRRSGCKTLASSKKNGGWPHLTLFAQAAAPYAQRASPQTTAVKIVAFLAAAPSHLTGLSASPLSVQTQPPLLALFIAGPPYH